MESSASQAAATSTWPVDSREAVRSSRGVIKCRSKPFYRGCRVRTFQWGYLRLYRPPPKTSAFACNVLEVGLALHLLVRMDFLIRWTFWGRILEVKVSPP